MFSITWNELLHTVVSSSKQAHPPTREGNGQSSLDMSFWCWHPFEVSTKPRLLSPFWVLSAETFSWEILCRAGKREWYIYIYIFFFEYTHLTTTYIKVNNIVSFSLEVCWKGWICPQCSPERNVFQFGSSAPWDFLVDPQGPKIVTQNWKSGCREEPTDPAAYKLALSTRDNRGLPAAIVGAECCDCGCWIVDK